MEKVWFEAFDCVSKGPDLFLDGGALLWTGRSGTGWMLLCAAPVLTSRARFGKGGLVDRLPTPIS